MGIVIRHSGERSDTTMHGEGQSLSERTTGGLAIFFFVLLMSTSVTTYGLWELAEFLISQ